MTVPLAFVATSRDLVVPAGATSRWQFRYVVESAAQSLAGYEAVFTVAKRAGVAPLFSLSSAGAHVTLEPGDDLGLIEVIIPADVSALLKRKGRYDLVLRKDDDVVRIYEGAITPDLGVTPVASIPTG